MKRLTLALGLGLMMTLILLFVLEGALQAARAASFVVCPDGPPACDYATIQAAVDAASDGDVIKVVGGVYTGVQQRDGVTQVVYINKSLTIQGGYTLTNQAVADPAAYPVTLDAQGQGRVIYAVPAIPDESISLTIEGLRLVGGDADSHSVSSWSWNGGGMYVASATLTLKNSQLLSNSALYYGGGLYLESSAAEFRGNSISNNWAECGGGGLYQIDSEATFIDNTFSSNEALFIYRYLYADGGGLELVASNATFIRNTISSNSAYQGGGLALYRSNVTLRNNTISSNTGCGGAGLDIKESNVTLDENSFQFNTGGGICNASPLWIWDSSIVTLTANNVSFNEIDGGNGGLSVYDSTITLDGNTISSNTADRVGGIRLESANATLVNNIIANNQAGTLGGGLYVNSGSSARLMHNTIVNNGSAMLATGSSSDDSGIHVTGLDNTIALTNNILLGHQVGITVAAGSTATLQGTLWGNARDWGGAGTIITGTHNAWGDPDFSRGYHIGPSSAARDAGVEAGVSDDMDGDQRPQGLGFDLGADELRVAVQWYACYLPLLLRK
jgi:hypothetical protein